MLIKIIYDVHNATLRFSYSKSVMVYACLNVIEKKKLDK